MLGVCPRELDRKSTRLNSSHPSISYAVFCLKKKKLTVRDKPLPGPSLGSKTEVTLQLSKSQMFPLTTRSAGRATSVEFYRLFFFFNDTATTEIYTLSLHDALPILALRPVTPKVRASLDPEADSSA